MLCPLDESEGIEDMCKSLIMIVVLSICTLSAMQAQAKSDNSAAASDKAGIPTIAVNKLDINDKALRLDYEIRNDSQQDVWLCDSVSERYNFEVYLNEDPQTLVVRKRLDVPSSSDWYRQPVGKYMRLRSGEKRVESLLLPVPVDSVHMYYSSGRRSKRSQRVFNAKRLSIEIGYYVGNFPEILLGIPEEAEKSGDDELFVLHMWFGGVLGFNNRNESLRQRDEKVLIPYTYQELEGEKVLRTTIGDLSILYKEIVRWPKYNPPDLTTCTRVEIQCEPSMLEYFYPYQSQQSLLDKEEMEYLGSEKTIIIEDATDINDLANEVKQAKQGVGGIVSEKSKANVFCYDGSRLVTSFIVYDDTSIEIEQKARIKYSSGLQSLRKLTPHIQPLELRMRCAANLKNLWHRMRLYDRAGKSRVQSSSRINIGGQYNLLDDPNMTDIGRLIDEVENQMKLYVEAEKKRLADLLPKIKLIYPQPRGWCDSMEWAFVGSMIRSKRHEIDSKMRIHVCPSVAEGLSTYAMNRKCKFDSPPDTVLLFETKAGWNQNGGPELFTFDNHEPKGGCVLLNDGTVKFIRNKEELKQLRWK